MIKPSQDCLLKVPLFKNTDWDKEQMLPSNFREGELLLILVLQPSCLIKEG